MEKLAIIGTGNLGASIALGLTQSGLYKSADITLTRRKAERLADFKEKGFITT